MSKSLSQITAYLDNVRQDLHFAVRRLRLNPGFSLVAVLMLTLGIGANTTVYSLMDQILLRPLSSVMDTEHLVQMGRRDLKNQASQSFETISYPDYVDYRNNNHVFESVAAFQSVRLDFTTAAGAEEAEGDVVTANYFDTLGIKAYLGNVLHQADEQRGNSDFSAAAVISADIWKRRFNKDANVIGATIHINKAPFVIVGVAQDGFEGTELRKPVDVWIPVTAAQVVLPEALGHLTNDRGFRWLQCVARLRPGVDVVQAQAEMSAIAGNLAAAYPRYDRGKGIWLNTHLGFSPAYRSKAIKLTTLLQAGAGLLLLITCSNLAALQLVVAARRHREMAIRSALGATKGKMVRQLIIESGLLSVLGATAAIAATFWAGNVLSGPLLGAVFPSHLHIELNKSVLGFTAGLALVTTLLFGFVPLWSTPAVKLANSLKEVTSTPGLSASATRKILVVCQVAFCFVLLIGASLLVRTLVELQRTDPGFRTHNILKASLDLSREGYDVPRGKLFYRQVLAKVQSLPGVTSACLTTTPPADPDQSTNIAVGIEGHSAISDASGIEVRLAAVTPEYFRALGLSVMQGRGFSDQDNDGAPLVAIVNESLARQFWPGQEPIGKHFRLLTTSSDIEVVGVARNSTITRLDEAGPQSFLYVPFEQFPELGVTLLVQSEVSPMSLLPGMTRELALLDPYVPLARPETLQQHLDNSLGQQRLMAMLIAGFAALALVLAELGLYALVSQSVDARMREMGIRIALGSQKAPLIGLVLKRGLILAMLGVACGVITAFALTPFLKTFLFRVQPTDFTTFLAVSLLLLVVASVASYFPARRAVKIDPITALRYE